MREEKVTSKLLAPLLLARLGCQHAQSARQGLLAAVGSLLWKLREADPRAGRPRASRLEPRRSEVIDAENRGIQLRPNSRGRPGADARRDRAAGPARHELVARRRPLHR